MSFFKRREVFLTLCGLAALALIYAVVQSASGHAVASRLVIGAQAPDFELADLNGRPVKLSDFRGKGVILNFWGSWCGPCVKEMPLLQQAYEAGIPGVDVIAVNVGESKGTIAEFIKAHGLSFTVLTDPSGDAANLYKVNGLPATFVVNSQGIVVQAAAGEFTDVRQIESLMGKVQP
ncbi:redoxin domain-containing protein [Paenibacillus thalictri]|nr:redoxin domain-containing protein [Paenibacillus thalictri]